LKRLIPQVDTSLPSDAIAGIVARAEQRQHDLIERSWKADAISSSYDSSVNGVGFKQSAREAVSVHRRAQLIVSGKHVKELFGDFLEAQTSAVGAGDCDRFL
jgi:hypothetical protein